MRLIIADTSPINYLLLIGHIEILPAMFGGVILPATVFGELQHQKAPTVVRNWIAMPPPWIEVRRTASSLLRDGSLEGLDAGEDDAIALAIELHADLLLMDDEEGVIAARRRDIEVTGTLGVLSRASQLRLLDLAEAIDRIKQTNFRYRQEIMDQLLSGMPHSG